MAGLIRDRANRRFRPLHIIAHSQGTMVARRAVQQVGEDLARQLVNNLVLLGPATAGTFAAAFAIAGSLQPDRRDPAVTTLDRRRGSPRCSSR